MGIWSFLFQRKQAELQAWAWTSDITLPTPVQTTLGSSVKIVKLRVFFTYAVTSDQIVLNRVWLAKDGEPNAIATKRGEMWTTLPLCRDNVLRDALQRELSASKSSLSKKLMQSWWETFPKSRKLSLKAAVESGDTESAIRRMVKPGETITFQYTKDDGSTSTRKVVVEGFYKTSMRARDQDGVVKNFSFRGISNIE